MKPQSNRAGTAALGQTGHAKAWIPGHARIRWWHFAVLPLQLCAADWPQYRGPNHDGISSESVRTNWSTVAPRRLWKIPIDPAVSSLTISSGKIFTQVRRQINGEDQE